MGRSNSITFLFLKNTAGRMGLKFSTSQQKKQEQIIVGKALSRKTAAPLNDDRNPFARQLRSDLTSRSAQQASLMNAPTSMDTQLWYYVTAAGATKGPLSLTQLTAEHNKYGSTINNSTCIWNGTTVKQWTPLCKVPDVMNLLNVGADNKHVGSDEDRIDDAADEYWYPETYPETYDQDFTDHAVSHF